jgi:hypothetical protein
MDKFPGNSLKNTSDAMFLGQLLRELELVINLTEVSQEALRLFSEMDQVRTEKHTSQLFDAAK